MANPDFRDLLCALNEARVDFMIVGAHALAAYGHVRATKDLDVWIRPSVANAKKLMRALRSFGAPLSRVRELDFAKPGLVFQIGVDPVRIDITTIIDGVTFPEAWPKRTKTTYGDQTVAVIGRLHLIKNKRAAGRLQDLADVEALTAAKRQRRK